MGFSEDASRKYNETLNFSAPSKLTLTMLKRDGTASEGIKSNRFKDGWDSDNLLKVFGLEKRLPHHNVTPRGAAFVILRLCFLLYTLADKVPCFCLQFGWLAYWCPVMQPSGRNRPHS